MGPANLCVEAAIKAGIAATVSDMPSGDWNTFVLESPDMNKIKAELLATP